MKLLRTTIKLLILLSLGLFIYSYFFQINKLPPKEEILAALHQEPVMSETAVESFEVKQGEGTYKIEPLYNYEISGLLVSYHHSASWFDYYHAKWKDYINVKDLCLTWGTTTQSGIYQYLNYSSGSWTCYTEGKADAPKDIWAQYDGSTISNNHILAGDEKVKEALMKAKTGDQIYLKGYLAAYYRSDDTLIRKSSTVIGDTDCETIYVTDFQILKEANADWRQVNTISKYSFPILIILSIVMSLLSLRPKKQKKVVADDSYKKYYENPGKEGKEKKPL